MTYCPKRSPPVRHSFFCNLVETCFIPAGGSFCLRHGSAHYFGASQHSQLSPRACNVLKTKVIVVHSRTHLQQFEFLCSCAIRLRQSSHHALLIHGSLRHLFIVRRLHARREEAGQAVGSLLISNTVRGWLASEHFYTLSKCFEMMVVVIVSQNISHTAFPTCFAAQP